MTASSPTTEHDRRPEPGDRAPDFTLSASGGRTVDSAALRGRPYLLYFYPKADTPGCTTQACDIQERLPNFTAEGLTIIGVSPDPVVRLDKFAAKFGLTFPLASDEDKSLAEAYGVWVEKTLYGRTSMGIERSSFLIDGEGVIREAWRKVKAAGHAELVEEAFRALPPAAS